MKLVDTYNNYKKNYKEYVVLIKSGIFYEVLNDDGINRNIGSFY